MMTRSWRSRSIVRNSGRWSGSAPSRVIRSCEASMAILSNRASASPILFWISDSAGSSRFCVNPANSSGRNRAMSESIPVTASMARSCARAGKTKSETRSPTTHPTATSITRSSAAAIGPVCVMVGPKKTITAVNGAALKRG